MSSDVCEYSCFCSRLKGLNGETLRIHETAKRNLRSFLFHSSVSFACNIFASSLLYEAKGRREDVCSQLTTGTLSIIRRFSFIKLSFHLVSLDFIFICFLHSVTAHFNKQRWNIACLWCVFSRCSFVVFCSISFLC